MEKSLEARMERVKEWLVGIWLFREPNKTPRWCGTFVYRGYYYDVSAKHSALSAVKAVEKRVMDLEKAYAKSTRKEKPAQAGKLAKKGTASRKKSGAGKKR
jgi:hypothetical protein